MITYKDKTFCSRKGCPKTACKSNLANVDWSFGLPVAVRDKWKKDRKGCPKKEPELLESEVKDEQG